MERPRILIAVGGDAQSYVEALTRAGFEAFTPEADRNVRPDLAVIDCDLDPATVTATAASLGVEPAVPTLLLIGESSPLPEVVGSRVAEVVLKPLPADALVYRLQALLIRTGLQLPAESSGWTTEGSTAGSSLTGEGHVVSVFAPKGGVGKTTIAVNMAVAVRQQSRADVLLFDADVGVGNVSSVLDVPDRMGLADLADSPPEDWTDAAFEAAVSTHAESGVRVLTWGTDPAQSERVTVDLLLAALRWARAHHSFVIVDNHPGYDDRTMAMLAVANEIFLVVTPEVGAIRNSSQFLRLARELGLGGVVRVIVNRANHGIRLADMEASLGLPVSATVVSNGPKAVIASNEGQPIITKFPREKISDDLHRVARLVTEPHGAASAEHAGAARRWWTRIGTRPTHA
jgi:pilus assembly protein CpaE